MKNSDIKVEQTPNGSLLITVPQSMLRAKEKHTARPMLFTSKPAKIYGIRKEQ